jgi:hypothetical protein
MGEGISYRGPTGTAEHKISAYVIGQFMGFTERRSLRLSLLKSLPKKHNSCDMPLYLEIYGPSSRSGK